VARGGFVRVSRLGAAGGVNWVEIDVDNAAEDLDHVITAAERLQLAIAIQ
jgi:hypothetical protein